MNTKLFNLSILSSTLLLGATFSANASLVGINDSKQLYAEEQANFYLLGMTNNSILAAENSVLSIPFAAASNGKGQYTVQSDNSVVEAVVEKETLVIVVNEVEEDISVNLRVASVHNEHSTEFTVTINVLNDPTFAIDNYDASLFTSVNIGDIVVDDTQEWLDIDSEQFSLVSSGSASGPSRFLRSQLAGLPSLNHAQTPGNYNSGFGYSRASGTAGSVVNKPSNADNDPVAALALRLPDAPELSKQALFIAGQKKSQAVASLGQRQIRFEPSGNDDGQQQPLAQPRDGGDDAQIRKKIADVIVNIANPSGGEGQEENPPIGGGQQGGNEPSQPESAVLNGPQVLPVVNNDPEEDNPIEPVNNAQQQVTQIPVPASWSLMVLALAGLFWRNKKSI